MQGASGRVEPEESSCLQRTKGGAGMSRICIQCQKAPADSSRRTYCRECARAYQRDWARKHRGSTPKKTAPRPLEQHEKWCVRCERILTRDDFYRETRAGDGLQSICKGCEAFRQTVKRHTGRVAMKRKKQRERSRKFRANNPGYNARACRKYLQRRKLEALERTIERVLP